MLDSIHQILMNIKIQDHLMQIKNHPIYMLFI